MLTHSAVEQWKVLIRFASKWHFLSIHKKCSLAWAFLTNAMLLMCHVWSSDTWTNACRHVLLFFSITISLILLVFSQRLFALLTPCDQSLDFLPRTMPLEMRPTTVINELDDDIWVVLGAQSCVNSAKRKGVSMQPWGEPVVSVWVEDVWGPTLTICGWSVRKLSDSWWGSYWMPNWSLHKASWHSFFVVDWRIVATASAVDLVAL